MTVDERAIASVRGDVVVACRLSAAGLAAQKKRWDELRARSEIRQLVTQEGKRMYFRADEGVLAELEELAAVENDCCSWATWKVESLEDECVLHVRSIGHGVDVIHGLFTSAIAGSACCDDCD
jgi:hypothetical protein